MLDLMYITNKPAVARIAQDAGVDRIFIDLERIGKAERQGGMDTVQSFHSIDDIKNLKPLLNRSSLLVRSNPIYENSRDEINAIIESGADIVMLPFFKTVNEAAKFIDIVNGRAKVNLLVETPGAVEKIDAILELDGIDEIHIGLNDLHLAYGMKFMFELLSNGLVESLGKKILAKGIKFGFGGIARLGYGELPAERIITEHYRLGSTCAILSRSFCNTDRISDEIEIRKIFEVGLKEIRGLERQIQEKINFFSDNKAIVKRTVEKMALTK